MSKESLPLLGATEIRRLAEELGIRPTKTLGQNFVIDGNTIRRIVAAAKVDPSETVLEVGTGTEIPDLGHRRYRRQSRGRGNRPAAGQTPSADHGRVPPWP